MEATTSLTATLGDANPRQLVVHAEWSARGLHVVFADGCRADVPAAEVVAEHPAPPTAIVVAAAPPYGVRVRFGAGSDFLPWDWLRGFGDRVHREEARTHVHRGRDEVAARVRAARMRAGLSQGDVARGAGVSRATVSRLENGQGGVTLATLEQIATVLGVRTTDLLGTI